MKDKSIARGGAEIFDIPQDAFPRVRGAAGSSGGASLKRARSAGAAPQAAGKRAAKPNAGKAAPRAAAAKEPGAKPREGRKTAVANGKVRQPGHRGDQAPRRAVKAPDAKRARSPRLAYISDDMFLEEWDARPGRKRHARKKARASRASVAVNLMLLTGIAAMFALGGLLVFRHNVFLEMKQAVEAQTFYEGTTVEGVDVSDMTLGDAMEYWSRRVEPAYAQRVVQLDNGSAIAATDLGYQSDYESVLSNAWSAGRRGSLEQRYRAVVQHEAHPVAYSVTREIYDENLLNAYVKALAAKIDKPAVDAGIESFDTSQYAFVFTESEEGRHLDAEGLRRQIGQALEAGGGSASVVVETVKPSVTTAEVSTRYGMITSAVTNASSSSSNRLKNIERAMTFINGKRLGPGEVFSFNDTVGKRTTDRGFRMATAYSSGTVTEEVGGGICQVSTTLFNAAVKADLEIVERHNHSLTVGYVDKGKDATVNWKSQDLKFRNTSGDDVYICCMLSGDKRVRFAIFGKLLENGETITLEAVTTKTIKYDTQYQANPLLAPGQTRVVEQGKNGFRAEAYKVRWDAAGNQISKQLLCKSIYKARDQIVQVGQ